ncbi:hypothetical Protein YC6258_00781 [Gynuella sunshinyii YC6258]|uniref:Uncharacterized protein n=1 Tax=Gynuella sunshinyii YC6258 TaxID=1445510 RepID=A0A0C5VF98_9GAMM|nr:hypothetical Protein YC6258_00781 [Gynuella sunshinyii YC6258]
MSSVWLWGGGWMFRMHQAQRLRVIAVRLISIDDVVEHANEF